MAPWIGPLTLQSHILTRSDGATIAYDKIDGKSPAVIFLHGLNSDRRGKKAQALGKHCQETGRMFIAFDMFGHGDSSGDFVDGTISRWTEDAIAVIDHIGNGPHLLVGSSMGGWVMLRAALKRTDQVGALIGIAAAPDFTEDLVWASLSEEQKSILESQGCLEQPSDYADEPYIISMALIEDGRHCLLLGDTIELHMPVCLIQGQRDQDVPWKTVLKLSGAIASPDVKVVLVKDGDHRLSRPEDLQSLASEVNLLIQKICDHQ